VIVIYTEKLKTFNYLQRIWLRLVAEKYMQFNLATRDIFRIFMYKK